MNGNDRFEYMAELFYKETGMMAPGKDSCADFGVVEHDKRYAEWKKWVEDFYAKLFLLHESNANCIENN
jgi:hypothetical protein